MRFINKKIIIGILMVIEICSLFLMYKSFNNKNTILDDVLVKENEVKKKTFAIMINDGSGNYIESSSNTFPTNMIYNEELSGCIDIRGNKIENSLTFENNMATLNTNTTAYCYLYFDKNNNVYNKLIDDYTNNNGVSLLSETSRDTYPVYYYTGDVTNNNIIYADYCWKMVRTTDTGGVKLIYNGVVTDGSCNNTEEDTLIDSEGTMYNDESQSLAYAGYMYNNVYEEVTEYSSVYGNSVTWDGTQYTLVDVITGAYYPDENHHYTCGNAKTTCQTVYYIYSSNYDMGWNGIALTNGKTIEDALSEMLYADDVNTTNSTVKNEIDKWYENNIKGISDSNGKLYSSYLENTIYCNNRATSDLGGFNPSGGEISRYALYFKYDSLECENQTDQFTLKVESGGNLGYGNNALDYPIGLLTYKEADLAINGSNTNYLNNNSVYWLMTPYTLRIGNGKEKVPSPISDYYVAVSYVDNGELGNYSTNNNLGVRPVLSLSKEVKIIDGNGEVNNPYLIELNQ